MSVETLQGDSMNFEIRQGCLQDARGISTVRVLAWQRAYRDLLPDGMLDAMNIDADTERTRRRMSARDAAGEDWIALDGEQVVGWATWCPSRDKDLDFGVVAEVSAIYVLPGFWRQGIGQSLLNHIEEVFRTRGFQAASLWVLEQNQRGRSFYERMGFRIDGHRKQLSRPEFSDIWEVRYGKSLPAPDA